MIDWKTILKDYWPVIAAILAPFAFFIQRAFSRRDKEKDYKREQKKIHAEQYYRTYNDFINSLYNATFDNAEFKLTLENVREMQRLSHLYRIALEQLMGLEEKINKSIYIRVGKNTMIFYTKLSECACGQLEANAFKKLSIELTSEVKKLMSENSLLHQQIKL